MKNVKLKRFMLRYCITKIVILIAFSYYKITQASFRQNDGPPKITTPTKSQLSYELNLDNIKQCFDKKLKQSTQELNILKTAKHDLPQLYIAKLNKTIQAILIQNNCSCKDDFHEISKQIFIQSKQEIKQRHASIPVNYRAYVFCCYYKSITHYLASLYPTLVTSKKILNIFSDFNLEYNQLQSKIAAKEQKIAEYHILLQQYQNTYGITE